jgi:hypothetical protein
MSAKVHVGEVGTVFRGTVKDQDGSIVDISTASVKLMRFKKPGGTLVEKNATNTTTGLDGQMQYMTVAGDLDEPGTWEIQGYVEVGGGKWWTDVHHEHVEAILVAR